MGPYFVIKKVGIRFTGIFKPFHTTVLFLYPLETLENQWHETGKYTKLLLTKISMTICTKRSIFDV